MPYGGGEVKGETEAQLLPDPRGEGGCHSGGPAPGLTGACGMPWFRRRAPRSSPSVTNSPAPTRRCRCGAASWTWAGSGCWGMKFPLSPAFGACSVERSTAPAVPANATRRFSSMNTGACTTAGSGKSPLRDSGSISERDIADDGSLNYRGYLSVFLYGAAPRLTLAGS